MKRKVSQPVLKKIKPQEIVEDPKDIHQCPEAIINIFDDDDLADIYMQHWQPIRTHIKQ